MAPSAAIRFLAKKQGSPLRGFVQLRLRVRVKPGASKSHEGILAVTSSAVQLCVAAQPRQGEANQAVLQVLSNTIGISKSRLRIVSGLKSRDKIATIDHDHTQGDGEAYAETILSVLHRASHATSPQ